MAMRIVTRMAEALAAPSLIEITSAHIDGCLYHGDGGVEFAERLVEGGGKVAVPATLNVGALDLLHPQRVRAGSHRTEMAYRQMAAYVKLGCQPTWTCAPYQAGHRPALGEHVAWGESNAVAFANSVLGAKTNRYGDFLDICCALVGRAPYTGLHVDTNRVAKVLVTTDRLPARLKEADVFFPALGSWLGAAVGADVAAIDGLPPRVTEDQLKALGAAAASTGEVALFHAIGVTPEAPDLPTAFGGEEPTQTIHLTPEILRSARDVLSTTSNESISAVALGSPHFSPDEFDDLERLIREGALRFAIPFYVCTGRGVLEGLRRRDKLAVLEEAGVEIVVDTCVVVTPILPEGGGVLMTNSGKFAHYAPSNTGYDVVYGSLEDCVASAATGRLVRDETLWG
jgi:predicted aconitase